MTNTQDEALYQEILFVIEHNTFDDIITRKILNICNKEKIRFAKEIWDAAKETVILHHYNGDTRPAIEVDKYKTLQDYLDGNAREGN